MVKHFSVGQDGSLALKGVAALELDLSQTLEANIQKAKQAFQVSLSSDAYLSSSLNLCARENFSKLPKQTPMSTVARGLDQLVLIERTKHPTLQVSAKPAKPSKPITSYSFYEDGDKFVKVILNLPGAESLSPAQLSLTMKRRQLEVKVDNLNNESYIFRVTRTHNKYVPDAISYVLKKDKIILKLTKENPKDNVFSLYRQKMVGDIPSGDEDK